MSSRIQIVLGVVLVVVGAVWTLQGLGWLGGSAMTGERIWALVGPVTAIAGAGLMLAGARRRPGG